MEETKESITKGSKQMSKQIEIEVHDILYEALEAKAQERNLSIDALINFMLADCFKREMDEKKEEE